MPRRQGATSPARRTKRLLYLRELWGQWQHKGTVFLVLLVVLTSTVRFIGGRELLSVLFSATRCRTEGAPSPPRVIAPG